MLSILLSILGILITILLVVGLHELGHFLVAKWVGVRVLRYSIGFGKTLFLRRDKTGTEYVIAAIPLGGYVKMLAEDDGEIITPADLPYAYSSQPFYKKMAIIAAGPLANLIFAFVLYWLLFVVGFVTIAPVIGSVTPHSIAANAGIQPQSEILQVDGNKTNSWAATAINIIYRAGDKGTMQLLTKNLATQKTLVATLELDNWHMDNLKPDLLESLGITVFEPNIPAIVGAIIKDSPAEKSNLLIGDKVIAIDGKPIGDWHTLVNQIANHTNETLTFTIERQQKKLSLPITLGYKRNIFFQKHAFLGMSPAFEWPATMLRVNHYGPVEAITYAWHEVVTFTELNFIMLGKMFTGKISLQSLGGPITIFESAGSALNHGLIAFMSFLAFLSISVGVVNILPIPGLDGGHLLFQAIEAIARRPIPKKYMLLFFRLGLVILLLVMMQALINDIMRL
jgi:regulator of sigma E protease